MTTVIQTTHKQGDWVCCWWCCHQFTSEVFSLPSKYDEKRDRYTLYGVFCSPNCGKAYMVRERNGDMGLQSRTRKTRRCCCTRGWPGVLGLGLRRRKMLQGTQLKRKYIRLECHVVASGHVTEALSAILPSSAVLKALVTRIVIYTQFS